MCTLHNIIEIEVFGQKYFITQRPSTFGRGSPVFSVTKQSWLRGMGCGRDSTSANASTMHFITCRQRECTKWLKNLRCYTQIFAWATPLASEHQRTCFNCQLWRAGGCKLGCCYNQNELRTFCLKITVLRLVRAVWEHTFYRVKSFLSLIAALVPTPATNAKMWNSWMRDQNHFNSHCAFNVKPIPKAWWVFTLFFSFSSAACQISECHSSVYSHIIPLYSHPSKPYSRNRLSPLFSLSLSIKMWNGSSNTKTRRSSLSITPRMASIDLNKVTLRLAPMGRALSELNCLD